MSGASLARNVYDVLTAIPPAPGKPDQAPDGEEPKLASWCGGAEAGTASAAADSTEGARRRRKRQRREGLAAGVDGIDGVGAGRKSGERRGVRWACGALQRRAWSAAWLALLRMPLPDDTFRKVCCGTAYSGYLSGDGTDSAARLGAAQEIGQKSLLYALH